MTKPTTINGLSLAEFTYNNAIECIELEMPYEMYLDCTHQLLGGKGDDWGVYYDEAPYIEMHKLV